MQRIIFAPFILIFLFCFNTYSQDKREKDTTFFCGNRCIESSGTDFFSFYSYADNKQFIFTVTAELIKKAPLWSLSEDNPPLSVNDAVKIAQNKLQDILINSENWKNDRVEIRSYQKSAFYIVGFKSKVSESNSETNGFFKIVVLTDGKAIEPKINMVKD